MRVPYLFLVFLATIAFSSISQAAAVYTIPVLDLESHTIGSAALLSETTMLTAAHVVDRAYAPVLMRCGKDFIFGLVTKYSEELDLAVIDSFIPCKAAKVLPVAKSNPDEGTEIFIQGFPGGGPRTVTRGIVSRYDALQWKDFAPRAVMVTDALIAGGNSGGPAYTGGDTPVLVGIVQAKYCMNTPRGMQACYGILAPVALIREFLGLD